MGETRFAWEESIAISREARSQRIGIGVRTGSPAHAYREVPGQSRQPPAPSSPGPILKEHAKQTSETGVAGSSGSFWDAMSTSRHSANCAASIAVTSRRMAGGAAP